MRVTLIFSLSACIDEIFSYFSSSIFWRICVHVPYSHQTMKWKFAWYFCSARKILILSSVTVWRTNTHSRRLYTRTACMSFVNIVCSCHKTGANSGFGCFLLDFLVAFYAIQAHFSDSNECHASTRFYCICGRNRRAKHKIQTKSKVCWNDPMKIATFSKFKNNW